MERLILTLCGVLVILSGRAWPQSGEPGGVSVRLLALGDLFAPDPGGPDVVPSNPAWLGLGEGVAFYGAQNPIRRNRLRLDPKGVAYRWRDVGLAWVNRLENSSSGIRDETFLSLGRRVSSYLAVGVSVKFRRVHPSKSFQVLGREPRGDLGLLVAPHPAVRLGFRFGAGRQGGQWIGALGGSWERGPWTAVGGVLRNAEGAWRGGGGLEYRPVPWLVLRGGLRGTVPALGLGVGVRPLRVDLTWTAVRGIGTVFLGATLTTETNAFE
ncbi:MAG: hypothetical protein KatS3mg115_1619 [Candidatus Poribacteria bacterium]|nr:MAG: hypothetical protein KatS3mg115_1619 [Candidatus Poribacteria bacterium]